MDYRKTSIYTLKLSQLFSLIVVLFLCFSMTACRPGLNTKSQKEFVVSKNKKIFLQDKKTVKRKLYLQFLQWKGTKYRWGGLDKKGVDCSGFVYLTYLGQFGIKLPRSTKLQSQIGKRVQLNALRSGDLLFFKTGWTMKHVGIYIENNMFLHVSTKNGVMISRLNDRYWKSKYWHARRVAFLKG